MTYGKNRGLESETWKILRVRMWRVGTESRKFSKELTEVRREADKEKEVRDEREEPYLGP